MKKNIRSKGEELLAVQLRAYSIPFKREYRFHPTRRWRFDFYIGHQLAVEVEGVTVRGGRHQTLKGFTADCEKYNSAALLGYTVLRFTTAQVKSGAALDTIQEALKLYT